jgi:hypothetical protein
LACEYRILIWAYNKKQDHPLTTIASTSSTSSTNKQQTRMITLDPYLDLGLQQETRSPIDNHCQHQQHKQATNKDDHP